MRFTKKLNYVMSNRQIASLKESQLLENRTCFTPKPVIGLSFDWSEEADEHGVINFVYSAERSNAYLHAVKTAGGVPFILSYKDRLDSVLPLLDGLIICGGRDMHPKYYGEDVNGALLPPTDLRMEFNTKIMENVPTHLPILGICWGMQFLNVYSGGSLVQDLPDKAFHHNIDRSVIFEEDSWLGGVTEGTNVVHCYHHQAIKEVGKGFRVVGWDEVSHSPHAFESTEEGEFRVGVQFHPEMSDATAPDSNKNKKNQAIFREFVEKTAEFKIEKKLSCSV